MANTFATTIDADQIVHLIEQQADLIKTATEPHSRMHLVGGTLDLRAVVDASAHEIIRLVTLLNNPTKRAANG